MLRYFHKFYIGFKTCPPVLLNSGQNLDIVRYKLQSARLKRSWIWLYQIEDTKSDRRPQWLGPLWLRSFEELISHERRF